MKHCPACNFSFPDFHKVCDFDGTELVTDPERLSLIKVPPRRPSRFPGALKSPVLWAGLLLMFVLSSAFLVAYLDATRQSTPIATGRPAPASLDRATAHPTASQAAAASHTPKLVASSKFAKSDSGKSRRQALARREGTRLDRKPSRANRSQKSEVARRRELGQVSDERDNKVMAMLKTTWRVVKKPFKF